ncbi:protein-disulfide reductase DsbD [Saccharobesus litoralis]|nr:protein-disulfide reductase DsbD [Saccharobesus litoralis]
MQSVNAQNKTLTQQPIANNAEPLFSSNSSSLDDLFAEESEQEPDFLPIDKAFAFNFIQNGDKVDIQFDIAPGYYLYKKQFKFAADNASFSDVILPEGLPYEDEYYGQTEIYKQQFSAQIPLNFALEQGVIKIRYQGCAEAGLCYPPSVKEVLLTPINSGATGGLNASTDFSDLSTDESSLSSFLQSQSWFIVLLVFFALGVGLALTPCVFPMYPILSSVLVGQEKLTNKAAFLLSLSFVQGMALTYAALGLLAALAGASFQAVLQSQAVLIGLSIMFAALAGSMFGWYELQLPSSWVNKLNAKSMEQKQGNFKGALAMGVLSGLIASPCTTAPLSGALLYVAQTGDALFGFVTLYILSIGMGLPLLIIGASSGKWLPKAGGWMESVKKLFAFILLAVPIMLFARFMQEQYVLLLAALLAMACAVFFGFQFKRQQNIKLSGGITLVSLLVAIYFGQAAQGYKKLELPFLVTTSAVQIQQELDKAKQAGQPVLLDITAEWCVGCKEFEHITFANANVQATLKDYQWLQLDVTEFNSEHDALIKSWGIVGPPAPTVMIFTTQGIELSNQRIRGFLPPDEFIGAVKQTQQ